MIKTFREWEEDKDYDYPANAIAEEAYDAGVKEASDHFEEEKIKIHEYYAAKLADLFDHEPPKGSDKNSGKLT